MDDLEPWKKIAVRLTHALADCLESGLNPAYTEDGKRVVLDIEREARAALNQYEDAGGHRW